MSKTKVDALYVSQPSDKDHQVKLAVHVGERVVVECHCGDSSPLCENVGTARDWWRQHAGLEPARADRSTAYEGD